MDVNDEQQTSINHEDESKKMDVDENDKQPTEVSGDTQIISDEITSTISKTTTNNELDSKKLTANDVNERDIKAAAASALAAAAVKAKVNRIFEI